MKEKIFIFLSLLYLAQCDKFRFDNYSLYKIYPQNEQQLKVLQELYNDVRLDFWSDPVKVFNDVDVLASPEDKNFLENTLNRTAIKFEITVNNIQQNIDQESRNVFTRLNSRNMQWNAYYTLEAINTWIDDLAAQFPNIVTVLNGGTSYEGRPIKGLRISHGADRKIIFLEGGIHSREWISPATVNYITNQLLFDTNSEVVAAATDFDWYIFPVANPDGYVWSHEQFRMWRKNRRPFGSNFGVDLNRNWNNNWLAQGSSINPALDNYAGPGPFSEPETRSFSTYISSIADRIDIYLSFHSYGQLLLLPFGNTTEPLSNYNDAINIGRRAMGALSVRYGTPYTTGNIAEAIYLATGGSVDWIKERHRVPLVYCYEVRDRGPYGFILPPDQILPTGEETLDSILELIYQARRFGYLVNDSGNSVELSMFLMILAAVRYLF